MGGGLRYGLSSMQVDIFVLFKGLFFCLNLKMFDVNDFCPKGWRIEMEDAHSAVIGIPDQKENVSWFAGKVIFCLLFEGNPNNHQIIRSNAHNPDISNDITDGSMASFLKRALRMEGPQLCQRTVTIKKTVRESLGMRIGGGIGSNEGDTPIYIANIHPHGCIGKSKNLKVNFG